MSRVDRDFRRVLRQAGVEDVELSLAFRAARRVSRAIARGLRVSGVSLVPVAADRPPRP